MLQLYILYSCVPKKPHNFRKFAWLASCLTVAQISVFLEQGQCECILGHFESRVFFTDFETRADKSIFINQLRGETAWLKTIFLKTNFNVKTDFYLPSLTDEQQTAKP